MAAAAAAAFLYYLMDFLSHLWICSSQWKSIKRVYVEICLVRLGTAQEASAKVSSVKPVLRKKQELVRRRSSDGFSMLLHCLSRLEKLYNQTLRTQVQRDVSCI